MKCIGLLKEATSGEQNKRNHLYNYWLPWVAQTANHHKDSILRVMLYKQHGE